MNPAQVAKKLQASPAPISDATTYLPSKEGLYAWWIRPGALPAVPRTPHPSENWDLLYIGIAPGRQGSAARLASRIKGNHIGGNTGSSTFRFSLAALLFERQGWRPVSAKTKVVLSREDNTALRRWQAENAGLTWVELDAPWEGTLEEEVIEILKPPMNLASNASHPFHRTMSQARSEFRQAALDD